MLRSVLWVFTLSFFLGGLVAVLFPSFVAAQQSAECGTYYMVRRGDTLSEIAERVYGRNARFRDIFEANRGRLLSPEEITRGDVIFLPCLQSDSHLVDPQKTTFARGIEQQIAAPTGATNEEQVAPDAVSILLVTASSFTPCAGSDILAGGVITDLVIRALMRTEFRAKIRLSFVDDWSVHLWALSEGDFELSFPWFKPDCSAPDALGLELHRLCDEFTFSAPLYEVTIAFYGLSDGPLAGVPDYVGPAGRRLCLPAGLPLLMLGRQGSLPDGVATVVAPDTVDCLERLVRGEVDAVAAVKLMADRKLVHLGKMVDELPALTATQTLHAVVRKKNPDSAALLASLNSGLETIKQSGEWFRVVSIHNALYANP